MRIRLFWKQAACCVALVLLPLALHAQTSVAREPVAPIDQIGRHVPTTLPDRMDHPRAKVVPILSDSSTVVVARTPREFEVSDSDPVAALMEKLTKQTTGIPTQAINLDSANSAILFPVAGNAAGAGGTYFRSDITLANYRFVDQRVAIFWLAQGQNNPASPATYVTLTANRVKSYRDFVGTFLGKSGLGAIVVKAVTASGAADALGQLDGSSRIYTPPPGGGSGSLSQMFPAVAFEDVPGGANAIALGLRHDSQFRTNAGVVNLDVVPHTWTVSAIGDVTRTFTITVQPFSLQQVSIPADSYGDVAIEFSSDSSTWWSAYAASVDNTTGDSWSAHAAKIAAMTPANADVTGTWTANVNVGNFGQTTASVSLVQTGTSVTGTAAIVGFGSGSISGTVSGQTLDFTIAEINPCIGSFAGTLTISANNQSATGGLNGSDCGGNWTASISCTKQYGSSPAPQNTANVTGSWNAMLIVSSVPVSASLTLVQSGTSVTGTAAVAAIDGIPSSNSGGSMTGNVSGQTFSFAINEISPCVGIFTGVATISADNRNASGTGSGSDCTGSYSATITGTKQ